MRKAILWVLIALMALSGVVQAETVSLEQPVQAAASVPAENGMDAIRTVSELYMTIPSGTGEMLVRVPFDGSDAVCLDRGDSLEHLISYGGGLVYLKTFSGNTSIMSCSGAQASVLYSFGASSVSDLSYYGGKLMVLLDGQLHSVDPATSVCLKLSGAQMLDYVVGDGYAYYLSGGDQMEYTAQLGDGNTASAQAGCLYRLNLNNGESDLLLKSGGQDLKIFGGKLYFHNLADAYAVRTTESAALKGRVYSLDVDAKSLESACTEPDSGFWPLEAGVVAWYNGALNLDSEVGELMLYAPENGSTVACDDEKLYVWEPTKLLLTEVRTNGSTSVLYSGDLTLAVDAALAAAAAASVTAAPTIAPGSEQTTVSSSWFENFMNNKDNQSTSSSGGSSITVQATPISYNTPVPAAPVATVRPNTSTGSTTSSSKPSNSTSSSGSGPAIHSTSIDYLYITGDVNLRSEPAASSTSKGVVPGGVTVECLGKYAVYSSGSKWYKIEYKGKTGWIYADFCKKSSSSSSTDKDYDDNNNSNGTTTKVNADYIRIVGGKVNIRASATTSSSSKGTIPNGGVATCLGIAKTDSRGVKWYKLKYKGITGWVSSQYAQPTNDGSPSEDKESTADRVRIVGGDCSIRASASIDSKRKGIIPSGGTADYLGKSKKDSRGVVWYKIDYDGITGWVSSRYADLYD